MILKVLQTGEDILRRKAKKLTVSQIKSEETQRLIDLMIATLRDKPGVGLAAPQVGESVQIVIIEDKKKYLESISNDLLKAQHRIPVPLTVIINPVLTVESEKDELFFEGCLSVEGYMAITPRARNVRVTGLDREGKPMTLKAEGWLARILQHEIDHLNGSLYVDTMMPRTMINDKYYAAKWKQAHPKELNDFIEKQHE